MKKNFCIKGNYLEIFFENDFEKDKEKSIKIKDINIEGNNLSLGNIDIRVNKEKYFNYPMILFNKNTFEEYNINNIPLLNLFIRIYYDGFITNAFIDYEYEDNYNYNNIINKYHCLILQKKTDENNIYFPIHWQEKIKEIEIITEEDDYSVLLKMNGNIYDGYVIENNKIIFNKEIYFRLIMNASIEIIFNNKKERIIMLLGKSKAIETVGTNILIKKENKREYIDYLLEN